jgi:MFS transporter, FHS family, L-fucose permease
VRLSALGIFAYVGAEVAIGSFLISFIMQPSIGAASGIFTEASAARYVSFYWGGAMIGRFIGAVLLARMRAGVLLAGYACAAAALVLAAMMSSGAVAMWAAIGVGFFNSIMFPNIFTLGIAGLGRLTGYASSVITMAIVGGAVIPLAQGALADAMGVQQAFFLPILCYGYIAWFAWWAGRQPEEGTG